MNYIVELFKYSF